jgi:O-antigen ligase
MLDKLFFVVLVLNATGLFRFVAPQLGMDIADVSLALLVLHGAYLWGRWRYLVPLLRRTDMKYCVCLLCVWPLITVLYAPTPDIRQIGLQLYYASLLCGTVVYAMANGLLAMRRVMTVSLALTILGIVLSMIAPTYFEEVAQLSGARAAYMGRAYGFFMQPNAAAAGIAFLFLGWYSLWKYKASLLEVVALLAFLVVMLLTGSRTGMLLSVIIVVFIITCSWRKGFRNALALRCSYVNTLVLTVCLIVGTAWMNSYASSRADQEWGLFHRIALLTSFKFSVTGYFEESRPGSRFGAQKDYWSLIKEKPLFGHGLGAEHHYLRTGRLALSSHSMLLTCMMQFGPLYPVVFLLLMIRLCTNRNRADAERRFKTNSVLLFGLITLLLFTVNGGLLSAREFYVGWALFFAAVYCPRCVVESRRSADWTRGWLAGDGAISIRRARRWQVNCHQDNPVVPSLLEQAGSR